MTTAIQIYDMKDVDEQLLATVPEEKWLPIPYWKDPQVKWLPLFYLAQSKNTIGLARNGRWFAIAENGYIQELTAALTIQWLVLLHEPLAHVKALITAGVKNSGLPEKALITAGVKNSGLPESIVQVVVDATVLVGLSGSSDFWQNLSLNWLAEIEHVDGDILAALEKMVTDGRTQKVRHKAQRILKSFYKSDI